MTRFPLAKMTGKHSFEQIGDELKITVTMTVTGVLGVLWGKIVAEGIVDSLPQEIIRQIQKAAQY